MSMIQGAIHGVDHVQPLPEIRDVFEAIGGAQLNYNWLITDCIHGIVDIPEINSILDREDYVWLTGEELTRHILNASRTYVPGGVFTGFAKDVSLEEVLRHPLPTWESPGFWHNPLTLQHPLAQIEIVPWDGEFMLVLSRDEKIVQDFRAHFPAETTQDLAEYNRQ